jgi:predicted methyltransferase
MLGSLQSIKEKESALKRLSIFSALLFTMACSSAPKAPVAPPTLPATIEQAVQSPYRTESNRARDQYRHPVETLNFFGLQPNMNVVEIYPGAGWYMEILAPLLVGQGHYTAAGPVATPDHEEIGKMNAKVDAWKTAHPEIAEKITTIAFQPPGQVDLGPADSADMVLTFRNVHNWMEKGGEKAAFKAFFKVLKPGGVLGVVEHRANAKGKHSSKGYVREASVIAAAKAAGFKLDKKSEINANPKDTKDYADGVWTLPPVLRLGDKDRDKYMAIGESDRMTLRFVKPAKKAAKKVAGK